MCTVKNFSLVKISESCSISQSFSKFWRRKNKYPPIFFSQCFGGQLCWVQHSSCCIVFTWFVKRQNLDFYKEQTLVSKKMKLYWDSPAALGRMCLRWKVKHDWDSCQRIYWEGKKYLVLKNYREVKRNCHLLCFLQFYNSTRIFSKNLKLKYLWRHVVIAILVRKYIEKSKEYIWCWKYIKSWKIQGWNIFEDVSWVEGQIWLPPISSSLKFIKRLKMKFKVEILLKMCCR